ncbi:Monocopper oxidase-like protein SKU5 [Camellia lanceoleosa]|uniref:Monocopper oxidase-like protein SKU5 n=1 Tax=Camellia lanceoleosa TaxID=1840588 RepID=A0ACC0GGA4_9ERIC|nr:Monocopper oxidase-like protein SKU5 [Camellia lanceoleosa]
MAVYRLKQRSNDLEIGLLEAEIEKAELLTKDTAPRFKPLKMQVVITRFVNQSLWQSVTGVAVLHYSNSKGKAAGSLPDPPNDVYDTSFLLNQAMSIRLDLLSPFIIKKLYSGSA